MTVRCLRPACTFLAAAMLLASAPAAEANWLSRLARGTAEVGEVAGRSGRLGFGALESAAAHIKTLPPGAKVTALAAEATPAGHWRFVNKNGDVFTAGTPDEMRRVVSTLAPDAATSGETRLALYLPENTIFEKRGFLKTLPPDADLHVVTGNASYRLIQRGAHLLCAFKPNVVVEIGSRANFDAALWQLSRPLNKSSIRTLALEPGGPRSLASAPKLDPASKAALVDFVDPAALPGAFSSIKGQTALITGRVEGDALFYQPASGAARSVPIADLVGAARAADVNLIILKSSSANQPGGRNWLWQKISVKGLDEALKRATFGDFLDTLGARRGQLTVSARPDGFGRVTLNAELSGPPGGPITGAIGNWLDHAAANITGHVATSAVQLYARDEDRQRELDSRIVPGIPSAIQYWYIIALVMGFIGIAYAWRWWSWLWPPEARAEYRGPIGYNAARTVRFLAFVLLFLPLIGVPAFLCVVAVTTWETITAPFRLIGRMLRRIKPQAG